MAFQDLIQKASESKLARGISDIVSGFDKDKEKEGFQFFKPKTTQKFKDVSRQAFSALDRDKDQSGFQFTTPKQQRQIRPARDFFKDFKTSLDRDKIKPGFQFTSQKTRDIPRDVASFFTEARAKAPTADRNYQGSQLQKNIQGITRAIPNVPQLPTSVDVFKSLTGDQQARQRIKDIQAQNVRRDITTPEGQLINPELGGGTVSREVADPTFGAMGGFTRQFDPFGFRFGLEKVLPGDQSAVYEYKPQTEVGKRAEKAGELAGTTASLVQSHLAGIPNVLKTAVIMTVGGGLLNTAGEQIISIVDGKPLTNQERLEAFGEGAEGLFNMSNSVVLTNAVTDFLVGKIGISNPFLRKQTAKFTSVLANLVEDKLITLNQDVPFEWRDEILPSILVYMTAGKGTDADQALNTIHSLMKKVGFTDAEAGDFVKQVDNLKKEDAETFQILPEIRKRAQQIANQSLEVVKVRDVITDDDEFVRVVNKNLNRVPQTQFADIVRRNIENIIEKRKPTEEKETVQMRIQNKLQQFAEDSQQEIKQVDTDLNTQKTRLRQLVDEGADPETLKTQIDIVKQLEIKKNNILGDVEDLSSIKHELNKSQIEVTTKQADRIRVVQDILAKNLKEISQDTTSLIKTTDTKVKDLGEIVPSTLDDVNIVKNAVIEDVVSPSELKTVTDVVEDLKKAGVEDAETKVAQTITPVEPVVKNTIDQADQTVKQVEDIILDQYGLMPRSADYTLLSDYSNGSKTFADVTKEVGQARAEKIVGADRLLKENYRLILEDYNKVQEAMGKDPVLVRTDSVKHMQEMRADLNRFKEMISGKEALATKIIQSAEIKAAKTPGPKTVEDVNQQTGSLTGTKQRKFIETVIDSDNTTPAMKEAAAKIDPQNYKVESNIDAQAFASSYIRNNGIDDAIKFVKEAKSPDQNTTAVGLDLMRTFQKEGRLDAALDILETLDQQGRQSGRHIQAMSMWSHLTPEGMLRFAKKTFDKANTRFTKLKEVELTPKLASEITTKMTKVQEMPAGPEKTKLVQEVMESIAKDVPNSVSEMIDSFRYQNMLSSPKTQMRNIYGNWFQGSILRPALIPFEVGTDVIAASLTGKQRSRYLGEVPIYMRNFYSSLPEATQAFIDTMKDPNIGLKRLEIDSKTKLRAKQPAALTVVTRLMEGMDRFFSLMIRNGENARLQSIGVDPKAAEAQASSFAEDLLFRKAPDPQNLSGQGLLLSKIDSVSKWVAQNPIPAARWFTPFIQTPTNVLKQGIELTPGLGLAALPGKVDKKNLIAKQALGSVVALFGAGLAFSGKTTWASPTDRKERELFYASGKKPYSFNPPGTDLWIPFQYLGPLAPAMALPAAANYYENESPTALTDSGMSKLGKISLANLELLSQQSYLSNVGSYLDILRGNTDRKTLGVIGFTGSQLIPGGSLIRYINTIIDPVYRKASGFTETVRQSLPGGTFGLEAYTKPDGTISTRKPSNIPLPYDLGIRDIDFEEQQQVRQSVVQQKKILSVMKKQLEEGTAVKADLSGKLVTSQSRDLIKEKIKLGMDVSEEELSVAYLNTALTMPNQTRFDKAKREDKLFASLSTVENNDNLTADQKDVLFTRIGEELGMPKEDMQTYLIAKEPNDVKYGYVQDQIDTFSTQDELLQFLVEGRKPVNGKKLVSSGVIDELVADGTITASQGKQLKSLQLSEDGTVKRKAGKGGSSKAAKARQAAVNRAFSSLKKIRQPGGTTPGRIRARAQGLQDISSVLF